MAERRGRAGEPIHRSGFLGRRWAEVRELTRHRLLGLVRVPEAVFWMFAFPVVLAAVLGYAFQSAEPPPSRVAVVGGAEAALVGRLDGDPRVEVERFATREAAHHALRAGRVDALLVDPAAEPPVVRLDPARGEAEVARLRILLALGEIDADRLTIDAVTERGSRYVDFLFPGLLGVSLVGTGLWSIGLAVAEMRQRKVLKRLLVTPMRKSSFLSSFMLSRLTFLACEIVVLTAFGVWVLGVPLRAGLVQLAVLCLLGATASAGLGLLTVSRVKTIEGASGMINVVMIPMWLGSGVFFSYERFPEVIQPVLRLLPLTALNDALRKTMLEGGGWLAVGPEIGILAAWVVVTFALAVKIFRWA